MIVRLETVYFKCLSQCLQHERCSQNYVLYYWILMGYFLKFFCLDVGFSSVWFLNCKVEHEPVCHVWHLTQFQLMSLLMVWCFYCINYYIYFISFLVIREKGNIAQKSVRLFKLHYKVRKILLYSVTLHSCLYFVSFLTNCDRHYRLATLPSFYVT